MHGSRPIGGADEVVRHRVRQHEGGKQGDPLVPLFFSLATHNALAEAKVQLVEGEYLFAYLDDNFVSAKPDRIRTIYELFGERLFSMAGSNSTRRRPKHGAVRELHHEGLRSRGPKRGVGSASRSCEHQWATMSSSRGGAKSASGKRSTCGGRSFGFPIQCAWHLLLQCAGPRCHHHLRTLPPSQSAW